MDSGAGKSTCQADEGVFTNLEERRGILLFLALDSLHTLYHNGTFWPGRVITVP